MATSIDTLRTEYRSHMVRAELSPDSFRSRCKAQFQTPGLLGRYVSIDAKDEDFTPEDWVKAAKAVADDAEYDRDCDGGEGYEGTGMSEAAYYTAAGSAEFL